MADLKTTASFDDSQVDVGLARMNQKFKAAGERLEKSTEGARKLSGAVSSVAGIATSLVGVFGLVSGAVAGGLALADRWATAHSRALESMNAQYNKLVDIKNISASLGEEQSKYDRARAQVVERLRELEAEIEAESGRFSSRIGDLFGLGDGGRKLQELIDQRDLLLRQSREIDRYESEANEKRIQEEQEKIDLVRERAAEEAKRAEAQRQRDREAAESLRDQVDVNYLRAAGQDEAADALEREAKLRERIRDIERAEGLTDAERRDLIDKARETARLEKEAAEARAAAVVAERAAPEPAESAAVLGSIGLAAGLGAGNALLQSQVFGRGGTPAEQQQLAESKRQTALQQQVKDLIERLVSEPRLVA